jgi:hypothetical protein
VQTLSAAGEDGLDPQVDVDADGDAVFAWQRSDGSNARIETRARSAAGVLSPVEIVSDPDRSALEPDVGVNGVGDAIFTWRLFDLANWRIQTVDEP